MIDIHCHLNFDVDDGPKTIEESIEMLKHAKMQGITGIILTPHYRHGMFPYPKNKIEEHYFKLGPVAKELGIDLYLGTEYHVNSDIIDGYKKGLYHTLADTRYVLTEYSHNSEFSYIHKMSQALILAGYIPVIAHIERYGCIAGEPEKAAELQELGAWIQVNADAVLGLEGRAAKKLCKKLLKEEWVDVVASDSHGIKERGCHMDKCYSYIAKKYGEDYARRLMQDNPARVTNGQAI